MTTLRNAILLDVDASSFMGRLEDAFRFSIGPDWLNEAKYSALSGSVFPVGTAKIDGRDWTLYSTIRIGPHTDLVYEDYTVGIVFDGCHRLFTGANRKPVGLLGSGSVYVLNNKKLHGAWQEGLHRPLVFAAHDFKVETMADAVDFSVRIIDGRVPGVAACGQGRLVFGLTHS